MAMSAAVRDRQQIALEHVAADARHEQEPLPWNEVRDGAAQDHGALGHRDLVPMHREQSLQLDSDGGG